MARQAAKPHLPNLLRNGDFATPTVWSLGENCFYADLPSGGRGLCTRGADTVQKQLNGEGEHAGGAVQYGLLPEEVVRLHVSGNIQIDWFTPYTGKGNFHHLSQGSTTWAFVLLEQLDFGGDPVRRDWVYKQSEPMPWHSFQRDVERDPRAAFFALSIGIYNGTGQVWLRSFQLVGFDTSGNPVAPHEPPKAQRLRAALFYDEGFPNAPGLEGLTHLEKALQSVGFQTERLNADQLGDPSLFTRDRFELAVLLQGPSFPKTGRDTLLRFLSRQGHLLSIGGYAFNEILYPAASHAAATTSPGAWITEAQMLEAAFRTPSIVPPLPQWTCEGAEPSGASGIQLSCKRSMPGGQLSRAFTTVQLKSGHWYAVRARARNLGMPYFWQPILVIEQRGEDGSVAASWRGRLLERNVADRQQFDHVIKAVYNQHETRIMIEAGWDGGSLEVDAFEVVPIPEPVHLNTAFGLPSDLILTKPTQMGIFDLDYPLKRAVSLHLSSEQSLLEPATVWNLSDDSTPVRGWATTGQTRNDDARSVPLLETADRYGRERGPASAVLFHYAGFFSGSSWAYFGLENVDVLTEARAESVARLAARLCRNPYLRNVESTYDLVDPGEDVTVEFTVQNPTLDPKDAQVQVEILADAGEVSFSGQAIVTVPAGNAASGQIVWRNPALTETFYRIRATLWAVSSAEPNRLAGDNHGSPAATNPHSPIDQAHSGFSVGLPQAMQAGPKLRFERNQFALDGHPVFLFGADNYQNVFFSSFETPLMQRKMFSVSRDFMMRVYENLQYIPDRFEFDERQKRALQNVVQQTQEFRLIYMPCLLVLTNVLVGEEGTKLQADFVRQFARWWKDVPGLIYYFNGDLGSWIPPKEEYQSRWIHYLLETYGTLDALAEAWGPPFKPEAGWDQPFFEGHDPVWDQNPADWANMQLRDRVRFLPELCRMWNNAMHAAVRAEDLIHPTTDEFFNWPHAANDIQQAIGDLTHANGNALGTDVRDVDVLPGGLSIVDLRSRGKGSGLGEYGCKTHPGQRWAMPHYCVRRTPEEQKEHFLAVQHYALGRGAAKIQHWCLRDSTEWIFPWGMFYPNGMVPKDIAYELRNAGLLFNQFQRADRAPEILFLLPDSHRLGALGTRVTDALHTAANALVSMQHDYYVTGEEFLEELSFEPKVIIWPIPFCPKDEVVEWLERYVRRGGRLYFSGDISYDFHRRPIRTERLERLLGLRVHRSEPARYAPMQWETVEPQPIDHVHLELDLPSGALVRPCVEFEPQGAQVLAQTADGRPVVVEARLGEGSIVYNADPTELTEPYWHGSPTLVALYRYVLSGAAIEPPHVYPADADLHVMRPPVTNGTLYVLFNRGPRRVVRVTGGQQNGLGRQLVQPSKGSEPPAIHDLELWLSHRRPGIVLEGPNGELVAVEAQGPVSRDGRPVVDMEGHFAVVALDERDISQSKALLVLPFSTGSLTLFSAAQQPGLIAEAGDFRGGEWVPVEEVPPSIRSADDAGTFQPLRVDEAGATVLYLICRPEERDRWRAHLSSFARHGYGKEVRR